MHRRQDFPFVLFTLYSQGFQMGVVGANQWKGGYVQYVITGDGPDSFEPTDMAADSYLGMNMTTTH